MHRRHFLQSTAAIGALAALPEVLHAAQRTRLFPAMDKSAPKDDWLAEAVAAARKRGAAYAEVLWRDERRASIQLRKEEVHALSDSSERGIVLRVFKDGAWGAAAVAASEGAAPGELASRACAAAEALSRFSKSEFDPGTRAVAGTYRWENEVLRNPFDVPETEKIEFLRSLTARALKIVQIPFAVANLFTQQTDSVLLTSRGADIRQRQVVTYPNFAVTAFHQKLRRMDNRSSSFEALAAGWEVTERNFTSDLETAMQEVLQIQTAEPVTAGTYRLVVHPSVLWDILFDTLLPHLDARRVLGLDGGRPGDRWIAPADIGHRRIGSPLLQLAADMTLPAGLATAGWDDSGRPATRMALVEDGVLRRLPADDTLGGLDAAVRFPVTRTAQWSSAAGPAMPNIVMAEGGDGVLTDLIAGVDSGLFIKGRGSIVTNPQRTLFRVKPQMAWMIRNGEIAEVVRGVEVETSVEQFWNALVAVGSGRETMTAGELFPGRTDALWTAPFSVSAPPALFADIPVYPAQEQQ
ncbi:MAG: TldD/PmbA family protein [Bacteroidota bacterium]|nr:TldD/PmbA family protein [Bacteroidota bacterium]